MITLTTEQAQQIEEALEDIVRVFEFETGTPVEALATILEALADHSGDSNEMVMDWSKVKPEAINSDPMYQMGYAAAMSKFAAQFQAEPVKQEPVAVVEYSDFQTAGAYLGEELKKKAVRELYEGALQIGQHLYAASVNQNHIPDATTIDPVKDRSEESFMAIGVDEALRLAEEAFDYYKNDCSGAEPSLSVFARKVDNALAAIRAARAQEQAEQEPLMDYERINALREGEQNGAEDAYFFVRPENDTPSLRKMFCQGFERGFHKGLKYASPVQQVDLTDDEIMDLVRDECVDMRWPSTPLFIARAVIAKFKEKNK